MKKYFKSIYREEKSVSIVIFCLNRSLKTLFKIAHTIYLVLNVLKLKKIEHLNVQHTY